MEENDLRGRIGPIVRCEGQVEQAGLISGGGGMKEHICFVLSRHVSWVGEDIVEAYWICDMTW